MFIKWFQVLLSNTNIQLNGSNVILIIQFNSHLFAQNLIVSSIENDKIFLFEPDGTLTDTTPSQSGPGSNGNEGALHISSYKTGASLLKGLESCHSGYNCISATTNNWMVWFLFV